MRHEPLLASVAVLLVALLSACSSEPEGPVAPSVAASPLSPVLINPQLQNVLVVPADPGTAQSYTWTPDGRLRYDFRLQNKTSQSFAVRVRATFYNDAGVPVDDQLPTRVFFGEYQDQPISVICANTEGKKVKVQVTPAN